MKRNLLTISMIALILLSYPGTGQCYKVNFGGQVSSLFALRDTSGYQDGFMDDLHGVQWRNTLDFQLTLTPEYDGDPSVYVDKVFMAYRGAYDAIFDARRDAYNHIVEHKIDDFDLGLNDVNYENDLREVFVDCVAKSGNQKVNLRLGRQIVRWGETDSFNVVNVPNPNDYSYQLAFSNPDDLATPLWMGRLDYTVVGAGFLDSFGIELLAIPDIRPTQQAPFHAKDGTVTFDAPYAYTWEAYAPMGFTSITEDVPSNTWENMEYAISMSFGIGDLEAALHYFVGHQDNPAIDWTAVYTGAGMDLVLTHPRQRVYGYSFNYFVEWANLVLRGEGCLTDKMYLMELPDFVTNFDFTGIEPKKVYQNLLGIDKDLHPSWIGTTSALSCAIEGYWKHVHDWNDDATSHPNNKDDTVILTCLFYTDYYHGQIKPTIFVMYDTEGAWMTNAKLAYDPDGKWLFTLAQSSFYGNRNAISDFSYGGAFINNSEVSFKVTYRF